MKLNIVNRFSISAEIRNFNNLSKVIDDQKSIGISVNIYYLDYSIEKR